MQNVEEVSAERSIRKQLTNIGNLRPTPEDRGAALTLVRRLE
jgi:hypothetical protein